MVNNPSNNVKYDSIDEVIIRLLGLKSGLELDYQTYFEIIKKKLAIARLAGKELPREEDELLREELKRVRKIKDTGARFKVRKKKTKISRTPTTQNQNQKIIAPAGGLVVRSPKEMLSPKDIIPVKIEDDENQRRRGYSELTPIQETLDSILDLLKNKFKLSQKVSDQERRDKELEKRSKRESLLEGLKGGISGIVSATRKMLSPLDNIFERIKRFIFFVLLGKAFTKFMEWMSDEENRKKFNSVIEFLADHWPAIAGLYVLFGTSFGRFIRSILKLSARMIVALAVNIPRMIAFIKKNKKLAFLGLAVAPLVTREISNALNTKEDKESESIGDESKNLEAAGKEAEKAKAIDVKPSPTSDASKLAPSVSERSDTQKVPTLNVGGLVPNDQKIPRFNLGGLILDQPKIPGFNLGGLISEQPKIPGFNLGGLIFEQSKIPGFNLGGLISEQSKIPGFNLGGLLSTLNSGGMNKPPKSGISPVMNVNRGIPITGAGQDDTLIAAKTGEAILTQKDQKDIKEKYVHKDSGRPLDIPKYLSGRKPGTVSADKLKFRGGFFEGGIIERFNSGGLVNTKNPVDTSNESMYPSLSTVGNINRSQNRSSAKDLINDDAYASNGLSMEALASQSRNITVQIETPGSPGSGVITKNNKGNYTVITAGHVLGDYNSEEADAYSVITSDGVHHAINPESVRKAKNNLDIASFNFTSSKNYAVAKPGTAKDVKENDRVFAAGFPSQIIEDIPSGSSGLMRFSGGRIVKKSEVEMPGGYNLMYSNITYPGMSGGAILNSRGELIGLDGRGGDEPSTKEIEIGSRAVPLDYFIKEFGDDLFDSTSDVKPRPVTPLTSTSMTRIPTALEKKEDIVAGEDLRGVSGGLNAEFKGVGEKAYGSSYLVGKPSLLPDFSNFGKSSSSQEKTNPIIIEKREVGGLVGDRFMNKSLFKPKVNNSKDQNLDYMKYFSGVSGENLIDPVRLKKTLVEILTTDSETEDYFRPRSIQKPEIKPYNQKPRVTTLPPIESTDNSMMSLIGKGRGGEKPSTSVPSFSAVSPVNDRELNARVYYGIE